MASATTSTAVDLRRASLGDVARHRPACAVDATCGPTRPPCGIASLASWAGLDDAAWHLPGAAPSDAGGPDWSLAEHVGHLADWQELAIDYVATAAATGRWPTDDDFDGGDFDRFNEGRRSPWDDDAARPRSWTA